MDMCFDSTGPPSRCFDSHILQCVRPSMSLAYVFVIDLTTIPNYGGSNFLIISKKYIKLMQMLRFLLGKGVTSHSRIRQAESQPVSKIIYYNKVIAL